MHHPKSAPGATGGITGDMRRIIIQGTIISGWATFGWTHKQWICIYLNWETLQYAFLQNQLGKMCATHQLKIAIPHQRRSKILRPTSQRRNRRVATEGSFNVGKASNQRNRRITQLYTANILQYHNTSWYSIYFHSTPFVYLDIQTQRIGWHLRQDCHTYH